MRADCVINPEVRGHLAWCGSGTPELERIATAVFTAPSGTRERMVYIADDPDPRGLRADPRVRRLLDDGQLTTASVAQVYGSDGAFDAATQLAVFEQFVTESLAAGFSGLRVVADNTALVSGDEAEFARWIAWEQLTDRFQSERPVTGVCYFDRTRLQERRLDRVGSVHPLVRADDGAAVLPTFRLFHEGGAMVLLGEVDDANIRELREVLVSLPADRELVVDVSRAQFLDHRTLLAFAQLAGTQAPVRLFGVKPTLRRLWNVLELPTVGVRFD
jgi:hypothetical protein